MRTCIKKRCCPASDGTRKEITLHLALHLFIKKIWKLTFKSFQTRKLTFQIQIET